MTASTMSLVAIAAVAAVVVLAASPSAAAPQSMANFGKGNINAYLMDPMLVRKTISCVEGVGPCTRLGNSLKSAIPTVLNNCKGCDQQQAANARKLIDYIQRNYPRDYDMILAKYRNAPPRG
ncbi:putative odorant-binding protein A10 [Frankliniella occidentalis]|uniref:Odorant-binding protein A10 n=1 Tax=Frankliniella occidentalis TaxID=133901 RepID=A0A6J1S410_FRAOC|nr:putative odorant-binding protein A10 [Frankliniella occidentalis]WBW64319.1 CSP8 [Frankliniella occidentalis]